MGIDKPNVGFAFHAGVSDSVDSHYQEIGRAGRDGEPAAAHLFYRPEDEEIRRFFGGAGGVDAEELEAVDRLEGSEWLAVRDDGEVAKRSDAPPLRRRSRPPPRRASSTARSSDRGSR